MGSKNMWLEPKWRVRKEEGREQMRQEPKFLKRKTSAEGSGTEKDLQRQGGLGMFRRSTVLGLSPSSWGLGRTPSPAYVALD